MLQMPYARAYGCEVYDVLSGRELCRRCGSNEQIMKECTKEPRCGMCCKHEGMNARHITSSLACPMVRMESRSRRR